MLSLLRTWLENRRAAKEHAIHLRDIRKRQAEANKVLSMQHFVHVAGGVAFSPSCSVCQGWRKAC